MPTNITQFNVRTLDLVVDDVEQVARAFQGSVGLSGGKFWINQGGEGTVMRFRQEGSRYVLEHMDCCGSHSNYDQDTIAKVFRQYNGKIEAQRVWESGNVDDLKLAPPYK